MNSSDEPDAIKIADLERVLPEMAVEELLEMLNPSPRQEDAP